jgi:hypothetical protein
MNFVSAPAEAAIINGSFESGMTGWTTIGDVNQDTTDQIGGISIVGPGGGTVFNLAPSNYT